MEKNKSAIAVIEALGTLIAGVLTSFATIHIYGMTTTTFLVTIAIQLIVGTTLLVKREEIKDKDVFMAYRRVIFILTALALYFCVVAQSKEPGTGGDIIMPTFNLFILSTVEILALVVVHVKYLISIYKKGKAITK